MTRVAALILLLMMTGVCLAGEETVLLPEVEVRSGPSTSPLYYVTGKLRAGERVEVKGEPENGFLKIAPPSGSYSLILKKDVQMQGGGTAQVVTDGAVTVMGGYTSTYNVRGTTLARGSVVTILGSESVNSPAGPIEYYKIVPQNEYRYIPVAAVRRQADIVQTSGTGTGFGLSEPDRGGPAMSPELAAKIQAAEQAYRRAEATGDWSEPLRLYKELEQCPSHEARMTAWNRLEFIKRKLNAPGGAGPVARAGFRDEITPASAVRGGKPPAAAQLQPRSSYTYATDGAQPQRIAPIAQGPPPPASQAFRPAPTAQATSQPNQSKYIPPPASSANLGGTVLMGRLVRSSKTDINGRPLYALLDSQNQIKCYVGGQNLERFVEQNVQVQGDGLVYQAFLRNNLLVASDVRPLN